MPPLTRLEIPKLWPLLPHPTGTFVRWFAKKGSQTIGGGVDAVEELLLAAEHTPGMNFYVAPNPAGTRAGTRHRTADVTHWSWFLIDVDPVQEGANPALVAEEVLMALGIWWEIDFNERRPLLIHSGRGAQIWIRLDDIVLDDERRRRARITNKYWLELLADYIGTTRGCRIDTTCSDLPRVMRCPGTMNMKTGSPAILIVPSAEQYEGLASKMMAGVPPEQFRKVSVQSLPSGTSWQSVYVHLTIRAQNYLTRGQDEPGRHDAMFHTALTLAEKGLPRDEVRRAIEWGNKRWDALHIHAEEVMALEPEDIEHALDTAFARLQRSSERDTMIVGDSPDQQEEPHAPGV